MQYALADVVPLRKVYEKLAARLEKTGRASWVAEEMAVLTDPATYRLDPAEAWRRLKPRTNNRRTLALVRELAAWRETAAQKRDLPRNRVVRDEALLEIAAHAPKNVDELARIRGLGRSASPKAGSAPRFSPRSRARAALPEAEYPELPRAARTARRHRPAGGIAARAAAAVREENDVAPRLIADTDDLEAHRRRATTPTVPALAGWRAEIFGHDALDLKHGRLALTASGNKIERLHLGAAAATAAQ